MRKRAFIMSLILFCVINSFAQDNEIWYTSSDGNIVTPNDADAFDAILISNTYENGKGILSFDSPVTKIKFDAFSACTELTSITIPSSVKSIGDYAFWSCNGLESITIPSSVASIGNSAFAGCFGLSSITIPESVINIGESTFSNCIALTSINVDPNNAVYDSRNNCNAIIESSTNKLITGCSITAIPSSVICIGDYAFHGCTGLTSITIPESVTSIGDNAFSFCTGFTSITIPESVTSIGDHAFDGCTGLTSITIPESVTRIGFATFSCTSLTSITIPESVISIGDVAFYGCTGLTSITIPESVTSIGSDAFDGTPWYDEQQDGIVYLGSTLYKYKGRMPANTQLHIQEGTTMICYGAFSGCTGLTSITIPESVITIGGYAFHGCTELTSITIPKGVTTIRLGAFCDCTGLTSITIPESVTSIEILAFDGCCSLAKVSIYTPSLNYYGFMAFSGNATGRKIYVFNDCLETYRSNWSEYSEDIIPITQTANDAGGGQGNWCSYYNGYADVSVPDGTTIYKAALNGESVTLTEIPGYVIKRGEAVILESTENSVVFSTGTWNGSDSDFDGNELQGVDVSTTQSDGMIYYVLSKVGDNFGFYKLQDGVNLEAGKAYLAVTAGNHVQPRNYLSLGGLDEGTTSVPTINVDEDVWYNMYGVKLQGAPSESGLYIHNGKSVMIK